MALFNCPECGKEMSDRAKACPNCGYRVNKSRKIIAIVLVSAVVIAAVPVCLFKFRTIDPEGEPTAAVVTDIAEETTAAEGGETPSSGENR